MASAAAKLQPKQLGRQLVDGDLQRGELRPAQHQHDAKRREAEGEGQRRRGRDGGQQHRQRHVHEGPHAARPQHRGALLELRRHVAPEGGHDAHDDGVVVEGVGQQDDPQRVGQPDGGLVQAEDRHQQRVRQPLAAEQRDEPHRDHDGRHDEGHRRHGLEQRLAGEVVPREEVGHGQPHRQRQDCRGRGLPCREPDAPQVVGVAQQRAERREAPFALHERPLEDGAQRVEEEDRQVGEGGQQRQSCRHARGPPSAVITAAPLGSMRLSTPRASPRSPSARCQRARPAPPQSARSPAAPRSGSPGTRTSCPGSPPGIAAPARSR